MVQERKSHLIDRNLGRLLLVLVIFLGRHDCIGKDWWEGQVGVADPEKVIRSPSFQNLRLVDSSGSKEAVH